MKSNRTIAIIFYLCAVVFYILAVINFFSKAEGSMGIICLGLGSMWLCLGTVSFRKSQHEDDDPDSKSPHEDDDPDNDSSDGK